MGARVQSPSTLGKGLMGKERCAGQSSPSILYCIRFMSQNTLKLQRNRGDHVSDRMKKIAVIGLVLMDFALLPPAFSQADRRIDGTWVGTETATAQQTSWDRNAPKPQSTSFRTTITIAQAGKSINKTGGVCPGPWEHAWWANKAINFSNENYKIKLALSPDGKTLKESGTMALSPAHWGRSDAPAGYGNYELLGTFHRQ